MRLDTASRRCGVGGSPRLSVWGAALGCRALQLQRHCWVRRHWPLQRTVRPSDAFRGSDQPGSIHSAICSGTHADSGCHPDLNALIGADDDHRSFTAPIAGPNMPAIAGPHFIHPDVRADPAPISAAVRLVNIALADGTSYHCTHRNHRGPGIGQRRRHNCRRRRRRRRHLVDAGGPRCSVRPRAHPLVGPIPAQPSAAKHGGPCPVRRHVQQPDLRLRRRHHGGHARPSVRWHGEQPQPTLPRAAPCSSCSGPRRHRLTPTLSSTKV